MALAVPSARLLAAVVDTCMSVNFSVAPTLMAPSISLRAFGLKRSWTVALLATVGMLSVAGLVHILSEPRPQQGITVFALVPRASANPPAEPGVLQPHEKNAGKTVQLSGRVLDEQQRPLPHAAVDILARLPYEPGAQGLRDRIVARGRSDELGYFHIDVPADFPTWFPERRVTMLASAPGQTPLTRTVQLPDENVPAESVELRLGRARPLAGRLVDADGHPASGVRLHVVRLGEAVVEPVHGMAVPPMTDWPAPAVTDPDGRFSFAGLDDAANLWVRVDDPRYALETIRLRPVAPRTGSELVTRLARCRPLKLEVVAQDNGAPLPKARITIAAGKILSHAHFCATDHGEESVRSIPAVEMDAVADATGRLEVAVPAIDEISLKIYPPQMDEPYLGVRKRITDEDTKGETIRVGLPRGRWISGNIRDAATGAAIGGATVQWGRQKAKKPEWRDNVLLGRDALAKAADDGSFRIAVLTDPCVIRVHGPSQGYLPCQLPITENSSAVLFAHYAAHIDSATAWHDRPIEARLRRGIDRGGCALDAAGQPVQDSFLLCAGRVSPVRSYALLPLPVDSGEFALPGCVAESSERVYFLDMRHRQGAVVDLPAGTGKFLEPVRFQPCGAATVRCLNGDSKPIADCEIRLSLMVETVAEDDEPSSAIGQFVWWFDPVNYPNMPKTNADGCATFPALIPGACYKLQVSNPADRRQEQVRTFVVDSGETFTVPDVKFGQADRRR